MNYDEEFEEPTPRKERKEIKIAHNTDVGKLVYEIIGKQAPPLFYAHCNNFVSDMLIKGYNWWLIELKLRDALGWCGKKGANHAGLRTLLNKINGENE